MKKYHIIKNGWNIGKIDEKIIEELL
jgi:hypothetical protein